jgi:uncharacterized protein (UPF0218 family)
MKRLTPALRELLKKPLGRLLGEDAAIGLLKKNRPAMLVSVGDSSTATLLRHGVIPDIAIYDYMVMRRSIDDATKKCIDDFNDMERLSARNPAGCITDELMAALQQAFKAGRAKVFVDGEEDLAALPAVFLAPLGSIVLYGQPNEGIVVIEVTESARENAKNIYERMQD